MKLIIVCKDCGKQTVHEISLAQNERQDMTEPSPAKILTVLDQAMEKWEVDEALPNP